MNRFKKELNIFLTENTAYKVVALVVTLVLWITILGREEIVVSRTFDVSYVVSPEHVLENELVQQVTVKVSGPRAMVKKFNTLKEAMTIDLNHLDEGRREVPITKDSLNLPLGVKILSIEPSVVEATIKKVPLKTAEEDKE